MRSNTLARIAAAGRVAETRENNALYNGGFEQKPGVITAQTNTANRWIDGTAAGSTARTGFGWAAPSNGSGAGANGAMGFDTTVFRNGTASMRLSNLTVSGAVSASTAKTINPNAGSAYELIRLQPNKTYILTGYIRTNNVPSNGAFIDIRELSASLATLATTPTNKLGGTDTSWRQVTATFTTNASTAFAFILLRNTVTGAVSDAWFDDIVLAPAVIERVAA